MRHPSLALALLIGLCSACNRQHMSDDYGRQTRRFFALQHVNRQAASGSPSGLDSEESALIQGTYKQSMGQQQNTRQDAASRVLLLQESGSDHGQQ